MDTISSLISLQRIVKILKIFRIVEVTLLLNSQTITKIRTLIKCRYFSSMSSISSQYYFRCTFSLNIGNISWGYSDLLVFPIILKLIIRSLLNRYPYCSWNNREIMMRHLLIVIIKLVLNNCSRNKSINGLMQ